jgi:hypothetical protein
MNRFLLGLLSLLWLGTSVKGSDSLQLLRHIPITARLFTTDPLGNAYLVMNNQSVLRLNARGDSIGFYNQVQKGVLTHIDATNPLRVILYYAQFGQVVILDNQTSVKSAFNLNRLGIFNAPIIANSADAQCWTYDPGTGELLKVDDQPQVRFKTGLRNVFDETLNPCFLVEQDRRLFLVDSIQGVFVFDQYGLYKLRYPIQTKAVQFFNDYLVYYQAPYLVSYHTRSLHEERRLLPNPEAILQVRLERNRIYVLYRDGLSIYAWNR